MVAAFGLEHLEASLVRDTVSAADVAEFLEQARADDVRTLAREGISEALDCLHRRMHDRDCDVEHATTPPVFDHSPSLPTPLYVYNRPNPEFRPTRHANRV